MAFLRVCSGRYRQGMRIRHVRLGRTVKVTDAVTFMAGDRVRAAEAYAGDIIGLPNHGSIRIADTFSEGEPLHFRGVCRTSRRSCSDGSGCATRCAPSSWRRACVNWPRRGPPRSSFRLSATRP